MTEPQASVPLWLLHEDELESFCASQPEHAAHWLREQCFKAERHRVLLIPDAGGRIAAAVAGLGKRQGELSLWHVAGLAERLPARRFHLAQRFAPLQAEQIALGLAYGAYRFERYRQGKGERLASIEPPAGVDAKLIARTIEALTLARDLINTPASDLGPAELANTVRDLAARHGAAVREWVGEELLTANFPAIHAVGRASTRAPRLIELRFSPAPELSLPRIALIGKGVCFDSGGLDLKTSTGMALMKKDMGGAAVAIALAQLLMGARLRAEILLLIPAVENAVSGNAYRPGDVLATRKGLRVEVGNTDAEGRLVLADALALADSEHPQLILDFATLTGAARVALGPELPAVFGSDEHVVAELVRAGTTVHDPLWPMPLWMGYDDELGSKIADLNNVASSGLAGAIFGALFLKRFVGATPWVHFDLFAWNPKDRPGRPVGAEAQAVRAVYRYLTERYGTMT
jgi:leucyl aminopeptidase